MSTQSLPVQSAGAALVRKGWDVKAFLLAARPRQSWSKNLILFGPLVFAYKLLAPELVIRALLAFTAFCLVSSATYVVNDLLDVENDRQHPTKRFRPLAAGRITSAQAIGWAVLLTLVGLGLGSAVNLAVAGAAAGYMALMLGYSTWLKHLVVIDVFTISGGFILRAVAGALAIHVSISPWLYVCTLLLALFLALSKRLNELLVLDDAVSHRRSLEDYTPDMLQQMTTIITASIIMAYSLYTFTADTLPANHAMMLTIPFVLYGVFRYQFLVHKKNLGGAPELALLRDVPLLMDVALWGITAIAVLYLAK